MLCTCTASRKKPRGRKLQMDETAMEHLAPQTRSLTQIQFFSYTFIRTLSTHILYLSLFLLHTYTHTLKRSLTHIKLSHPIHSFSYTLSSPTQHRFSHKLSHLFFFSHTFSLSFSLSFSLQMRQKYLLSCIYSFAWCWWDVL